MEKRTNTKQKIALERIWRLFELAEKASGEGKPERSKRYLQLAKRIGEKMNVSVPKELKKRFCKKCFSVKVEAKEEKPFLAVKCGECGFVKRFGLEEKEEGEDCLEKAGKKKAPKPAAGNKKNRAKK